jgi:AmmeMemoRadiSam system protein B
MTEDPPHSASLQGQEHLVRPHLRQFQPLPGKSPDGKPVVLLRDPLNLVPKPMVVAAQALSLLAQFQGQRTVAEIAEQFSIPLDKLKELVAVLDQHALLWGPVFTEKEQALKEAIIENGCMPRGAAFMLGEDPEVLRKQLTEWLGEVEDPELESAPRGLVLPHLDYHRGWPLYASGYRALEGSTPPDRVVILGTNHFGIGDGVVGTQWNWETPFGHVTQDTALNSAMGERLGPGFFADQLDHVPEHSIQLHLPWIQHLFGDVPVFGALVPDPLIGMVSDDGKRTGPDQFLAALKDALAELGGTTFLVASSDLSPQFGEPAPVDDDRKAEVEHHDRDMLSKFLEGDSLGFIEAMSWSKNPTRWCSIGNMAMLLDLAGPDGVIELLDYRQATQEGGTAMVSASACALL